MDNPAFEPVVSVIVITWNSAAHLPRCLAALCAQTFTRFEVVIVDNGSSDGCVSGLEQKFPGLNLRLEQLSSNTGFAIANNLGARLARGRWLALLNADAFPEPGWLEALLDAAYANPEFTCFSSRLLIASDPHFLDGAGDAYHASGLAWKIATGYPSDRYGRKPAEVFSPCAAAALYLRDAFLDAGGFDEEYLSYFEDVDLGFRLRLYGQRCLYVPFAVAQHVGSASFGQQSEYAFYHTHRNLVWTYLKNMPASSFWKYLPAHLMANFIYMLWYGFGPRGRAIWRGKLDALRGIRRILRKRREVQARRRASTRDLERAMQHGWLQPYLLQYDRRRALKRAADERLS